MIAQSSQARTTGVTLSPSRYGQPFNAGAVTLRHLKTPAQIAAILHLRDEIDLSAQTGANFLALEKKETNWALSLLSTLMAKRSAPSESCPCASN